MARIMDKETFGAVPTNSKKAVKEITRIRALTIEAFNGLIVEGCTNGSPISVDLSDVKKLIIDQGVNPKKVSQKNMIRTAMLYKTEGWGVQHVERYESNHSLEFEPPKIIFTALAKK
jgi:hypothetical protein